MYLAGNRILITLLLANLAFVPGQAAPAQRAPYSSAFNRTAIDAVAKDALARAITPGMAIGIMKHGKIVFVSGYGLSDIENAELVRADTTFLIGSISKQLTAAAIFQLQEQRKLSIDDSLAKYFPKFPNAEHVTLRQMLAHTAGIRDYAGNPAFKVSAVFAVDKTTDEMIDLITNQDKLYDFEPGSSWVYSNSSFFLLGAIVEKLSGQPLGKFLETNIFVPCGLTGTRMDDVSEIVPHRGHGHIGNKGTFANVFYHSLTLASGAGELRSTAPDLLNWTAAFIRAKS